MLIPSLKDITAISAGGDYMLALDTKGHVFAWGNGEQTQLGRRVLSHYRLKALLPAPVPLPRSKKFASIHAGLNHAFAIDTDGNSWAWGLNNFAQTGIATNAGEGEATVIGPKKIPSLVGRKMKTIQGGAHHSIGVTETGKCLVWGRIDGYQMGIDVKMLPLDEPTKVVVDERGSPRILLQPTSIPNLDASYVAAGTDHNIVITTAGKAYSWGFNANYQCAQGTTDDIEVATLIDNTAVRHKKLVWAGAGGQFSIFAAEWTDDPTASVETKPAAPLTNGVNGTHH
jgi:regulator of chromosome condensation